MPIKAVSEMLGHSSIAITMTIYAHVLPDSHAQVAEAMARLLLRPPTRDDQPTTDTHQVEQA